MTEYTSERVASIAGRVLAGEEVTQEEVKALAGSALTQREPGKVDVIAAKDAEIERLREALQGLLDALPSATTHPAISAARAALTPQETEE